MYTFVLYSIYDHKVIRVYIELFIAEHRAVIAEVYAINVIDFLFSTIEKHVYVLGTEKNSWRFFNAI